MLLVAVVVASILMLFLLTALVGAPYVPSQRRELAEAFGKLRPLRTSDVVLDIGSGDGVVLQMVSSAGARSVGYELNPILVVVSRLRLHRAQPRPRIELKNFWTAPFPDDTTLVYTFGESRDIGKMYRKVRDEATRLNRPLELLSYGFAVPGIEPTRQHRAHFLYHIAPLQSDEA